MFKTNNELLTVAKVSMTKISIGILIKSKIRVSKQ